MRIQKAQSFIVLYVMQYVLDPSDPSDSHKPHPRPWGYDNITSTGPAVLEVLRADDANAAHFAHICFCLFTPIYNACTVLERRLEIH